MARETDFLFPSSVESLPRFVGIYTIKLHPSATRWLVSALVFQAGISVGVSQLWRAAWMRAFY
jgi:hypothetical protein